MQTTNNEERTRKPVRTCVGCHRRAAAGDDLVRVVLGPMDGDGPRPVVVDVAGTAFGRGAHLHPTPACIAKACAGGLAKVFSAHVSAAPEELAAQLDAGCDRRIEGLLLAARRAKLVTVGNEARRAAANGAPLAIVACDAGAGATKEFGPMIARGAAIAWKDKVALGAILGRDEVSLVVVDDHGIARETLRMRRLAMAAMGK